MVQKNSLQKNGLFSQTVRPNYNTINYKNLIYYAKFTAETLSCKYNLKLMKKNKTKLTLQDSNLRLPAWMLFLTLRTVALPTELKVNVAASGVTHFFNRGHTSRLKFVFSLSTFLHRAFQRY